MENDNVVNGLLRRRQEVADALEIAQGQVRQLVLDLDALDSTLRLFRPDVEIGVVRIRPVPRRHAAVRHESSRLIYSVLREAGGPLTTRELARAVMEARGMNTADHAMAETMRVRLASMLRKLKNRGKGVAEKREGKTSVGRWREAQAVFGRSVRVAGPNSRPNFVARQWDRFSDMAIFAVIVQAGSGGDGPAAAVRQHFGQVNYQLDGERGWLVAARATAKEVSDILGITDGTTDPALVVEVASYFGRANPNIWTWIKNNWEAGKNA